MLTTTTNSPLGVHVLEKTLAIRLEHRERNRWTLRSNELLWKAKCFSYLYGLNSADGECNRKLEEISQLTQIIYKYIKSKQFLHIAILIYYCCTVYLYLAQDRL